MRSGSIPASTPTRSDVGTPQSARPSTWRADGRRPAEDSLAFLGGLLAANGFDPDLIAAADDESHDDYIRAETELALSRTGRDVGTPILTFHPGEATESSYFGPVIAKAPKGEDALKLWDAVETMATMSGMAELKRSLRDKPDFT